MLVQPFSSFFVSETMDAVTMDAATMDEGIDHNRVHRIHDDNSDNNSNNAHIISEV